MNIKLTVISTPDGSPLLPGQVIPLSDGQIIGRAVNNQLILDDPSRVISSKHAEIKRQDEQITLVDHSTNGTFYNDQAIGRGQQQILNNGDHITIGDYQFSVALDMAGADSAESSATNLPPGLEGVSFLDSQEPTPEPVATPHTPNRTPAQPISNATPFGTDKPEVDDFDQWLEPSTSASAADGTQWQRADSNSDTDPLLSLDNSPSDDPLLAFNTAPGSTRQAGTNWGETSSGDEDDLWWQAEFENVAPSQQAMPEIKFAAQPRSVPPQNAAPAQHRPDEDTGPLATPPPQREHEPKTEPQHSSTETTLDITPPAPTQAPIQTNQQTSHQADEQTGQLGELLGLEGLSSAQQANLLKNSADIVHSTTDNLLSLLQSRASIKNELRTSRTMIQTTENNPLKFSASASEALRALFTNSSDAFLPAGRAVDESFNDIADHQVAVLYAMKVAFEHMLEQFQPSLLENKFRGQGKGLLTNLKTRTWDNYHQHYEHLKADKENTYNQLFGESFSLAYEQKLEELKTSRLNKTP